MRRLRFTLKRGAARSALDGFAHGDSDLTVGPIDWWAFGPPCVLNEQSPVGGGSGFRFQPIVVPAYVIEDGKAVVRRLPPDDPRAEQFFNSFLPALHSHVESKKW